MNKVKMIVAVMILLSTSIANANVVEDKMNAVKNWATNEKSKTVEFQKVKWQEGKDQIANTILKIKKLFNWSGN
jgi:hypothetical protein